MTTSETSGVDRLFTREMLNPLEQSMNKIEHCLGQLDLDQIWFRIVDGQPSVHLFWADSNLPRRTYVTDELKSRAEEFKMEPDELEKMFGGPQFRAYLKNELVQKKLFDFLLGSASVKKGEKIDYTDLMGA